MASAESDLQEVSDEPAPPAFRLGYRAELDGLRGIAVVLVVVYHLDTMWPDLGRALLPGGYLGVDLFLVLSGFLITSLLIGEHDATGAIARRAFFGRRALRLVPALVALLAAVLAVAVVDNALLGRSIYDTLEVATAGAWVLTFTGNWAIVFDQGLGPVGHLWTIALEGQFYVIWGLVLVALLGRRPGLVPAVALAGVAAVAAWRLHHVTARPADLFSPYVSTLTRLDAPLLGAAAGAWVARGRVGWIRGRVADACVVAGLGAVVTAAIVSVPFDGWLFRGGFTLVAAMAALAVVGAVQGQGRIAARWLRARPLVAAGRGSYSLYLWHVPVFLLVGEEATSLGEPLRCLIGVAVAVALAWVSYTFVERPFMVRKVGRAPQPGTSPVGA